MTVTPEDASCDERSLVADSRIHAALIDVMSKVGLSLGICSYGLIIGDSYVPFDPDEEDECGEDEQMCEQAWVRVELATPAGGVDSFGGMCGQSMTLSLEIGILRCLETPEKGEAPKASEMLVATLQSMDDMNAIYRGAMSVDENLLDEIIAGEWTPLGPLGGQYGGSWTFTVTV